MNAFAEKGCYLDRELSWLQFNLRVLQEAADRNVPLLERLNFVSIYNSNLDEFFMVRVGSLRHRAVLMPDYVDPKTGWNTVTQLKEIAREVNSLQAECSDIYKRLLADFKAADIEIVNFNHIAKLDESLCRKFFEELAGGIFPQISDSEHPLPFLENREEYIVFELEKKGRVSLALVSCKRLPAFKLYELSGKQKVIFVPELIRHFAHLLFPKSDVKSSCCIRVTRNADVFIDENNALFDEDFRKSVKRLLRKRQRQSAVRLQIYGKPSAALRETLAGLLQVSKMDIYYDTVPFNLSFGPLLSGTSRMRYAERKPARTVQLKKGEYFRYLEKNDILLSFPYQSITPFIEMLYEAADDPEVTSIKITLYRLAASSRLAAALAYASDRGKDVLCLLELRARFDEKNNIDYSEMLEQAGCRVIYGLPRYKVHSKICLITRSCGDKLKYITQVGTGNYNELTSEHYCDLSLITSDEQVGKDAEAVFDSLSRGELPEVCRKLWIAPKGFKPALLELLEAEREKGSNGFIAIKVNSINDIDVMNKLVECSMAGNVIQLFVRGICCIRPGVEGFTDNITVKSVVGRYLEHSRVYVLGKGDAQRIFIGSADLLNRNTQRRVEALIELTAEDTKKQAMELMEAFSQDDEKGWYMQSGGGYIKTPQGGRSDSQERLYTYFSKQTVENKKKKTVFPAILRFLGFRAK